jgi:hypothetical protein
VFRKAIVCISDAEHDLLNSAREKYRPGQLSQLKRKAAFRTRCIGTLEAQLLPTSADTALRLVSAGIYAAGNDTVDSLHVWQKVRRWLDKQAISHKQVKQMRKAILQPGKQVNRI